MTRALRWPVVIVLSSLLLSGLVLVGVHSPVRLLVTAWFLLVCTGMAFAPLFRIPVVGWLVRSTGLTRQNATLAGRPYPTCVPLPP